MNGLILAMKGGFLDMSWTTWIFWMLEFAAEHHIGAQEEV